MSVGDAELDRMDQTMMGGELDNEFGSAVMTGRSELCYAYWDTLVEEHYQRHKVRGSMGHWQSDRHECKWSKMCVKITRPMMQW
jgi:hypothetical protein